ncbi:SGNH/GDSL hydrolase family protein [Caulobacter sp. 73W]|uniref:SGNH/GDSL hydrolase family protein n=1 Tax=Caulobacter sp. 73W TaxID=3161137 RepID=A0AB39KWU2_9CAUL
MWAAAGRGQVLVENATIRFTVRIAASGDSLRLRLSNEFGLPLKIGAASVRIADGPSVPVTFNGAPTSVLPLEGGGVSDAVPLAVRAFDLVEVSLFLPERTALNTVHGAGGAKTAISAPGDFTATPFEPVARSDNRPLLASVEVAGPARPVVVAYGNSITDNTGCANDATPICRWGDLLGRRLAAAGKPHVVVTQAISGNRLLAGGSGPTAIDRFTRDVLSQTGVSHVIVLEGINDIGQSGRVRPDGSKGPVTTAEQLISGYEQLIARAHERGVKVMALTILPFEGANYYTAAGEALRMQVNDWIRTSGSFDGVFDMEKVMADPTNPKRLNPALQRGDNLHPDGVGEAVMGEAIPLDWFN